MHDTEISPSLISSMTDAVDPVNVLGNLASGQASSGFGLGDLIAGVETVKTTPRARDLVAMTGFGSLRASQEVGFCGLRMLMLRVSNIFKRIAVLQAMSDYVLRCT